MFLLTQPTNFFETENTYSIIFITIVTSLILIMYVKKKGFQSGRIASKRRMKTIWISPMRQCGRAYRWSCGVVGTGKRDICFQVLNQSCFIKIMSCQWIENNWLRVTIDNTTIGNIIKNKIIKNIHYYLLAKYKITYYEIYWVNLCIPNEKNHFDLFSQT